MSEKIFELGQKSADASRFRRRPRKARRASTPPRARGRSSLRVRSFGSVPLEVRTRRERHDVSAGRITSPTPLETSAFPADAPVPPNRSRALRRYNILAVMAAISLSSAALKPSAASLRGRRTVRRARAVATRYVRANRHASSASRASHGSRSPWVAPRPGDILRIILIGAFQRRRRRPIGSIGGGGLRGRGGNEAAGCARSSQTFERPRRARPTRPRPRGASPPPPPFRRATRVDRRSATNRRAFHKKKKTNENAPRRRRDSAVPISTF